MSSTESVQSPEKFTGKVLGEILICLSFAAEGEKVRLDSGAEAGFLASLDCCPAGFGFHSKPEPLMPDAKEATRFMFSSEAASDLASPVRQQGKYNGFGVLHHTLLVADSPNCRCCTMTDQRAYLLQDRA